MSVLAALALLSTACMALGVCLRALALARRSGELPERLMGSGLAAILLLGAPLSALGRAPTLIGSPAGDLAFAVGLGSVCAGAALLYAFTWQVFRPRSFGGLLVLIVACGALGAAWHGLLAASAGGTMEIVFARTRLWGVGITALMAGAFLWTAAESGWHRVALRRRQRLGLADAVVVNRMDLWLLGALAVVVVCGSVIASMLAGVAPLRSPVFGVTLALAGSFVSACWGLAFFPPPAYLAWVDSRASRSDEPAGPA